MTFPKRWDCSHLPRTGKRGSELDSPGRQKKPGNRIPPLVLGRPNGVFYVSALSVCQAL